MNIVDTSGWLEYLADSPLAGNYAAAILYDATIPTQDAHFEDLPQVKYFAKSEPTTRD